MSKPKTREVLPPEAPDAAQALNRQFIQRIIAVGDALRVLCRDRIRDTRSADWQAANDMFDELWQRHEELRTPFFKLTEQGTPASILRGYFGFYLGCIAAELQRIFAALVEIGQHREGDGIKWAHAQAAAMIASGLTTIREWVRFASDGAAGDPQSDALGAALADEYEHRMREAIDAATIDAAKRPPQAVKIIDAKEIEGGTAAARGNLSDAQAEERAALIEGVNKAKAGATLPYAEAALIFEVSVRTIRNWLDEGRLNRGEKRGTITAASIRRRLKE